jgi:hypothetical protein
LDARARCHDPAHHNYRNYGARGIQMCKAWRDDYRVFLREMGRRPGEGYEIDRRDNEKGYEVSNCRWVPRAINVNNRRVTKFVTYKGETLPLMDWARRYGLTKSQLYGRLYQLNWPVEQALTTPPSPKQRVSVGANHAE